MESNILQTATKTIQRKHEFIAIHLGLTTASGIFLTIMQIIFCPIPDKFIVTYLYNILIFLETLEKHRLNMESVFSKLPDNQLQVKPNKRLFT
jgi:hypothetical protein